MISSIWQLAQSCFSHPNETRGETIYHFCLETAAILLVIAILAALLWAVTYDPIIPPAPAPQAATASPAVENSSEALGRASEEGSL